MKHKIRWTSQKIARRINLIEGLTYRRTHPLPDFRYLELPGPEAEPPIAPETIDAGWEVIPANTYWGKWTTNFVLRTTFEIPADWPKNTPVALYLPLGEAGDFSHPETLAYLDGVPHAACDRHHQEILLTGEYCDGKPHDLALHGWTGLGDSFEGDLDTKLYMRPCAVVQIDQPTRDFIAAARVALGIADELNENEPAKGRLLNALNEAFNRLELREPLGEAFYESIPSADEALLEGIDKAGPPLDVDIVAAGHAHIDVAWLWTVGQSRRKSGRTFHNVLRLMEQFPEYKFTQSQPQLYDYLRQDYPELLEAIKLRIADARWEPIGGMWVEADCNVSGGEALARQFLLGRTFFREHFGPDAESPVLWLPDVFGYAWNLPQLIKEAGLEYFFTIKISWSQYNRIPFDSFWWQGLDGTRVLTHFSTTQDGGSLPGVETRPSTYNSNASPKQVLATWKNMQQKETHSEMLMAFGFGDGGGGPTREMLENIRELNQFPAAPRLRHGTALEFFKNLEDKAGSSLPTWNGELYLEYHRGTYTTQAKNKRNNRKSEFLLHDAEFLAAWAALATGAEYPHAELTRAWQLLCLNQFHDILPGSSINEVYVDSDKDYAEIAEVGEKVRDEALAVLGSLHPEGAQFLAVNPTSFSGRRNGLIAESLGEGLALVDLASGEKLALQPVEGGTLIEFPNLAAYSQAAVGVVHDKLPIPNHPPAALRRGDQNILENELLRVTFAPSGDIVSIYDKSVDREVLPVGERANVFQAFEDRPLYWDAWDIDIFYDEKQWETEPAHSIEIIETGPIRVGLEIHRVLGASKIIQRVYLYRESSRIDFDTRVDWRERHVLLKVAFPVDILSPDATFDVQWGNVQRPTHRNTSWDWARFETCAHKWVDLSEGDYGVSLLNDCKYGCDVGGNVIRLTLLKSPTYPDPVADWGEHRFTYSLLPHTGDWRTETVASAYAINDPVIIRRLEGGAGPEKLPSFLVSVDSSNVIIETVKQAEDGNGLIVRLYENERSRGPVVLKTGFPLAEAFRCNLLEETYEQLEINENAVYFSIKPYKIVTLRLVPV